MNKIIKKHVEELGSTDDKTRLNAFQALLKETETKVDWIYEVWDHLLEKLEDENFYQRSIGIMMLCNLAKSDTENRSESALDRLLIHTRDEKFITSRQCIQNIWKIAAINRTNREKVLEHLEKRFVECADEKHYNLLRQDVVQAMISLEKLDGKDGLLTRIQALIAKEPDIKNRKKYEALLKANVSR